MTKVLMALAGIILILPSCEKDEAGLPEATNTAADTFGMLVDGIAWIPSTPRVSGITNHAPEVRYFPATNEVLIRAEKTSPDISQVYLYAKISGVGRHHLSYRRYRFPTGCPDSTHFNWERGCSDPYRLQDSTGSILDITTFDLEKSILSGTFRADLVNNSGNVIAITDGRFDAKFTKRD